MENRKHCPSALLFWTTGSDTLEPSFTGIHAHPHTSVRQALTRSTCDGEWTVLSRVDRKWATWASRPIPWDRWATWLFWVSVVPDTVRWLLHWIGLSFRPGREDRVEQTLVYLWEYKRVESVGPPGQAAPGLSSVEASDRFILCGIKCHTACFAPKSSHCRLRGYLVWLIHFYLFLSKFYWFFPFVTKAIHVHCK